MGVKLPRKKPRHFIAALLYRLLKLPISERMKFKWFLDLEWIFNRLSHEQANKIHQLAAHPWRESALRFISDGLHADDAVVDIGCGYGELASLIAGQIRMVVGVDQDAHKIETAKRHLSGQGINFICLEAQIFLQNTDIKFSKLILSHVLEHIDEPEKFLITYRSLFDHIFIEVPDFDATVLNHFRADLNLTLRHTDNDHVTEFDRHELKELFADCGLEIVDQEFIFGVQRYWLRVVCMQGEC
jgi:SAM-dependent methyltransferase